MEQKKNTSPDMSWRDQTKFAATNVPQTRRIIHTCFLTCRKIPTSSPGRIVRNLQFAQFAHLDGRYQTLMTQHVLCRKSVGRSIQSIQRHPLGHQCALILIIVVIKTDLWKRRPCCVTYDGICRKADLAIVRLILASYYTSSCSPPHINVRYIMFFQWDG